MTKGLVAALAGYLAAAAAFGGVVYTATLDTSHELGAATDSSKVRVWIADGKAKAEYVETSIPGVNPGDALLTLDGGATSSLLNFTEKTVAPVRVDGTFGNLWGVDNRFEGLLPQTVSNVAAAVVESGEGEPVAGRPTVRTKLRVSYLTTRVTRRGDVVNTNVIEQEVWVTPEVVGVTPPSWPLPLPLRLDRPEIQEVVAKAVVLPAGLPLKAITTRTVTSSEGQERVVHGRFEVLELEVTEVPYTVFAVPEGFQKGEFRANTFTDPTLRAKRSPRDLSFPPRQRP